jgi:acetate kinase
MPILVVNVGSSTLKLRLLDDADATLAERELAAPRAQVDEDELRAALEGGLNQADAVGHRIVHGGQRFRSAVRVDAEIEQALRELVDLAPLHQPKSLTALDTISRLLPDLPAYACFDTAFHATLPPSAFTYAVPRAWRERWGVRRYGFHGLSHAYASRRASELLGVPVEELRIVTCHLGAGASLAAVRGGHSIDTTMGFTPLEGLVMATRCGSVDPGLLLWLLDGDRVGLGEMSEALEHEAGLAGLAGSADMREILARAGRNEPDARLALDVYVHHLRAGIAAMAATLGGLDVLVFTGGVGERAPAIRESAAERLGMLGVAIDPATNAAAQDDAIVSPPGAGVATVVVAAREDLEIARQVRSVLSNDVGARA